ncbi:MAG: prepilin-type N-terminal cleavage/methylation domain-containing protein [Kiritimatiellales bacterium]|nr:prepilin-type N-terminal cleavage/methylation domain-containing protein [Kiritimatiellales bacterium]
MNRKSHNPSIRPSSSSLRPGFTLIEIVLVLVIVLIISGISLPFFAQSYRGTKLRVASRTLAKTAMYARNMAILRGKTHTLVLSETRIEIIAEATPSEEPEAAEAPEVEEDVEARDPNQQLHRNLPDGIRIAEFETETEEEPGEEGVHYINYYPNGMSDAFRLVFEDPQGLTVEMFSDPISGKVTFEFVQ